jgi:hypothetical protein
MKVTLLSLFLITNLFFVSISLSEELITGDEKKEIESYRGLSLEEQKELLKKRKEYTKEKRFNENKLKKRMQRKQNKKERRIKRHLKNNN